jgi:hypothetical protein
MENSALARILLDTPWAFPTLETLHFIGLIFLMGSLYVMDLRLMGFARAMPISAVLRLVPVSVIGFLINLTTGTLFLFTDPYRYYPNLAFRLKMLAILLAGLNLLWFKFALNLKALEAENAREPGLTVRWIGGISMLLWTSVIVLGRMIPYLE